MAPCCCVGSREGGSRAVKPDFIMCVDPINHYPLQGRGKPLTTHLYPFHTVMMVSTTPGRGKSLTTHLYHFHTVPMVSTTQGKTKPAPLPLFMVERHPTPGKGKPLTTSLHPFHCSWWSATQLQARENPSQQVGTHSHGGAHPTTGKGKPLTTSMYPSTVMMESTTHATCL